MAVVVRYFSPTSAGAGDGTSWANRAALFSGSNYSTIITAFDFTNDSLECRIGPGSYSGNQNIQTAIFTVVAPSTDKPLWFVACDSSGNRWQPPNPNWCSAQPIWDTTNMPVITLSTAAFCSSLNVNAYGLDIVASHNGLTATAGILNWCRITNNGSGASVGVIGTGLKAHDCVFKCTSTSFGTVAGGADVSNCRVEGNSAATTNNRRGTTSNTATGNCLSRCTFIDLPGGAYLNSGTGATLIDKCLFYNCGPAVVQSSTSSSGSHATRSMFINNGTAVNFGSGMMLVSNNRFRGNTTNMTLGAHSKEYDNITSAGSDADEFVNAAGGDYRIKNTSSLWGLGLGPGDEAAPASSGGGIILPIGFNGGI